MSPRKTQVKVPERGEEEPDATPEQLQQIRALVQGMSLQGYRFDYRRMGVNQASSVIQQLSSLSSQSAPTSKPRRSGPGCFRKVGRLAMSLLLLAAFIGGGYVLYTEGVFDQLLAGPSASDDEGAASTETASTDGTTGPDKSEPRGELRESKIFAGQFVRDDPDTDGPTGLEPRPADPGERVPEPIIPPVDPKPTVDATAIKQIESLKKLLAQLSEFTRSDYPQAIRQRSVNGMLKKLSESNAAMQFINSKDASLTNAIQTLIERYGEAAVDGESLRKEIKALQARLDTLRKGS